MCVIVDNSVRDLVFRRRNDRTEADNYFFDCIDNGKLKLVVGGKLLDELKGSAQFIQWFKQANSRGLAIISANSSEVNNKQKELEKGCKIKSDDPHVLALAIVSKARILYTHDDDLKDDFKDNKLISNGKVFRTNNSVRFTTKQRKFLDRSTCNR